MELLGYLEASLQGLERLQEAFLDSMHAHAGVFFPRNLAGCSGRVGDDLQTPGGAHGKGLCGCCCRALVHQRTGRLRVLPAQGGQPRESLPSGPVVKLVCARSNLHKLFSEFGALALVLPARGCWTRWAATTNCSGGDRAGSRAGHGDHMMKIVVDVPPPPHEFDFALVVEFLESRWGRDSWDT